MQSTSKRHCSEDNDSRTTKRFRASDERSDGDDLSRDLRGRTTEGRGGASRQERIPRPLCYKALEEICNSNSPEEGILDLANKSKRFEALLNSKTEIRADLMKLVIRAIHLCCSPNDVKRHAERMLHDMIKTNFLRLHLSSFISQMSYNSELKDTFQPSDMILRLAEIFLELLQRFGRDIVDSIPLAQLSETLGELKGKGLLHADTDMLDKKVLQVREYRDEVIRRKIESARKQEDQSTLTPPENYREISVIPQAADLNIHHKPFLRVNVVDGSYKDQEHYLDVQFRLLREDFILPLREGIRQLQKDRGALGASAANHSNHAQDVQVYRDVTVLYPVCSGKGMVYRIRFDAFDRRLRHVNWDKCKFLKFGSLLCLSTDDFYTPLFATIENRNPRELCLGELEVRFEDIELEILNRIIEEKEKFDMVESPAFFVAYRHVLEGLKEIEPDGLPFQEYIVKCNRDVEPPYYEKKMNGFFDMSGIIEDEVDEQQHGLSNSGSSNSMEVNHNDRGDGGGTAADDDDSMEVKYDGGVGDGGGTAAAADSMEVKDDGGVGGGTAAAAAADDDDDDSMEVKDDGGGGVGDGGGTAAAADDGDDDNNYDNDDDDGNNPSQVPEYRNWLVREWDSESDDSDWVPSVYEVMSEDDAVSSGSDLASVTSDSHSVDSNEVPGDENSANDRPAGVVVNIYDLPFHRESLGFDESQMRAFKMALTKKFAVIQGPPGTGKTYVGLKIARVLLQSVTLWQRKEERSPILMVSYTNHALDEFLSGLPMEGIVRVGGRCSDKLKGCSLKVRRDEANAKKKTPRRIATARRNVRQERRELEQDGSLERCITVLKCSRRGILAFHVLKQFMSERHVRWFEKEQTDGMDDLLCYWLGVKRVVKDRDARKKHDRDVVDNEDFQMQISGRNFSNEQDFEDDNAKRAMKPSEVSICTTEDNNKSAGLRRNLHREDVMFEGEEKRSYNLQRLSTNQRWKLYRLWVQKAEKHYLNQLQKKQPDYERTLARNFELMLEEDYHVLRNARVIGMTTTCAAKYRRILQRIGPKIVLVEEAAEVLEAHIITSLTKKCEHLILIGDHQQLRPTPEVYELAKKYKLEVSLFERMVNVGIQCERLSVQHRMRPEIAALMKHIYDDLENHESVEKYEDIKGMKKNMFFISHSHLENTCDESHSHGNEHEAKFLVALCRYLIQQGYTANKITLLTTYTGQMFVIRDCLQAEKNEELDKVRLTTVDNFQGEENDIILLSLVRSNQTEKVGFIKIVNRACVALSRAKKGFYCIGNFDLLSKHSDIWSKIVADLEVSGSIGNALPLVCQIHHEEMTAEAVEDFSNKAPDGGCQRPCQVRLECGHACKRSCHPYDTEHVEYCCGEPCAKKIVGCDHVCPRLCCKECETDCPEFVEKTLPRCGHSQTARCGKDVKKLQCKEPCDKMLSTCAHRCQSHCGKPCTAKCQELVKRTDWPCGHEVTIACSATPIDCPVPCGTLECNDQCSGSCGECRMGRVHKRCRSRCRRVLVCSHLCRASCTSSCPPCSSQCENRCGHSKCEHECGEACIQCKHKCKWKCPHYKCDKRCGEVCSRPRCDEPCKKVLRCGRKPHPHTCRSLCGEQCICAVCEKNEHGKAITEISYGGEDEEDALFVQLADCKHIFAVSDLDKHMDTSIDDTDDRHMIQLKSCPRCKTVIRTSLRYGNVIKQQLHDIEEVKKKVRGNPDEIEKAKVKLQVRLSALEEKFDREDEAEEWKGFIPRCLRRMSKGIMTAVTENQVTLTERFCVMDQTLKKGLLGAPRGKVNSENRLEGVFLQGELQYLKKRFMSEGVTHRELRDINLEFTRLKLQLELCLLKYNITSLNLTLDEPSGHVMKDVRDELTSGKLIQTERLDELLEMLAAIRRAYPCLSKLTPEERKQIVSAMNLSQGHWYKCPQGHIYAITECGGAMEKSTCPECGAVIGGTQHRLEEGNEVASEMDGAKYPAWSDQANLQNYVIVDEA